MSDQRIDAPRRIVEAMENAQRQVERINTEVQAILFGAAAALDVPEGWQWDGSGWSALSAEKEKVDR